MSDVSVALREALGDEVEDAHFELDDVVITARVRPRDGDSLARTLGALHEHKIPALLRGGGSHMNLGNPLKDAEVLVSTERVAGIEELDTEEGVLRARAGTKLTDLREALAEERWCLPFDVPEAPATLGGVLATAVTGPRVEIYGAPRDRVLGLDVVTASGARTRCGGRVVKNVTGYDLSKLYVGSLGTLGVIEAAWIRLVPRPDGETACGFAASSMSEAVIAALPIARRPGARAVAVVSGSGAARVRAGAKHVVCVLLAGDGEWRNSELRRLEQAHGAEEISIDGFQQIGELQAAPGDPHEMRIRIMVQPTSLPEVLDQLAGVVAHSVSYPGMGVAYLVVTGADDADRCNAVCEDLAARCRDAGGTFAIERAPVSVKRGRDVFGPARETLPLLHALKRQFDPAGVLNRGRSPGCL